MPAESMPPYFPFWAKDWITSEATRLMSLAARGAYADLLAVAWLSSDEPCTIPSDDASIARLLSVSLREWRAVAKVVREHFEPTDSGRLRNARLWTVFCDVQAKRDKMSRGGRKGAEHRWKDNARPSDDDGEANREAIATLKASPMATKAKAKVKEEREGAGAPTLSPPASEPDIAPPVAPAVAPRRKKGAASGVVTWTADGSRWWVEHVGDMNPGRFGKALSSVVGVFGWPPVFADMQKWVAEQKDNGRAVVLTWYADRASARLTASPPPMYDYERMELTPYGERMTRPDGLSKAVA